MKKRFCDHCGAEITDGNDIQEVVRMTKRGASESISVCLHMQENEDICVYCFVDHLLPHDPFQRPKRS